MALTTAPRALQLIADSPWAMPLEQVEIFHALAELAMREGLTAEALRKEIRTAAADFGRPSALAADPGNPLEGARRATVRDGVAILRIQGPLFHYADFLAELCGATSYETLAADHRVAMDSPDVHSILLLVDSPGGHVNGVSELAQMFAAGKGTKRTVAYVAGASASAAYWLSAAADEVIAANTALLGSIGAVFTFRRRKAGEAEVLEIVSSQTPRKRVDLETEEGRSVIQTLADDLADVFIETVAQYRGTTREKVLTEFGGGSVMIASKAIAVGLADRIGTFEDVLAELAQRGQASSRGAPAVGGFSTSHLQEIKMETQGNAPAADAKPAAVPEGHVLLSVQATAEQVSAAFPTQIAGIRAASATTERDRILAIEAAALPGHETLVAELKRDPAVSAGDAALRINAAERGSRSTAAAALSREETDLPKPGAASPPATPGANSDEEQANEMIAASKAVLPSLFTKEPAHAS